MIWGYPHLRKSPYSGKDKDSTQAHSPSFILFSRYFTTALQAPENFIILGYFIHLSSPRHLSSKPKHHTHPLSRLVSKVQTGVSPMHRSHWGPSPVRWLWEFDLFPSFSEPSGFAHAYANNMFLHRSGYIPWFFWLNKTCVSKVWLSPLGDASQHEAPRGTAVSFLLHIDQ